MKEVKEYAKQLHLTVSIERPGDGAVRYRFFRPRIVNEELVEWGIGSAEGRALALAFLDGYEEAMAAAKEEQEFEAKGEVSSS